MVGNWSPRLVYGILQFYYNMTSQLLYITVQLYQPVGYNLYWLSRHDSIQIIILCAEYAADFKALNSFILASSSI